MSVWGGCWLDWGGCSLPHPKLLHERGLRQQRRPPACNPPARPTIHTSSARSPVGVDDVERAGQQRAVQRNDVAHGNHLVQAARWVGEAGGVTTGTSSKG